MVPTVEQEVAESKVEPVLVEITSRPKAIVEMAVQVKHLKDTTNTCLAVVAYQAILEVLLDIIGQELLDITVPSSLVVMASINHMRDFGTSHQDQEP